MDSDSIWYVCCWRKIIEFFQMNSSLIFSLSFFIQPIPEHGFSFHFEMYKTPKDRYYLQLFLRQPGDENPQPEKIKECGTKCSLRKFYKIYDELIPDEFEVECGVKKPKPDRPERPDRPDKPDKPDKPDHTDRPEEPDHTDKPNHTDKPTQGTSTTTTTTTSTTTTTTTAKPTGPTKSPNAAAINGNGQLFSIVLCSLWFIRKCI